MHCCWEASSGPPVGTEYVVLTPCAHESIFSGIGILSLLYQKKHLSYPSTMYNPWSTQVAKGGGWFTVLYSCVDLRQMLPLLISCVRLRQILLLLIFRVSSWLMPEKTDSWAQRTNLVPSGCPLLASQQQCTTPDFSLHTHVYRLQLITHQRNMQLNMQLIPMYTACEGSPHNVLQLSSLVIMTCDFVTWDLTSGLS